QLDENGNTTVEEKYDSDGELEERNSFVFNANSKLLEHILLYAVEDVTERRLLNRDEKGRLTEETKYYGDDSGEKTAYVYDENDRCIMQELFDSNGVLLRKNMYEFDEEGNVIHETTYEMDTSRGGRDKHFETRYEYMFY